MDDERRAFEHVPHEPDPEREPDLTEDDYLTIDRITAQQGDAEVLVETTK